MSSLLNSFAFKSRSKLFNFQLPEPPLRDNNTPYVAMYDVSILEREI